MQILFPEVFRRSPTAVQGQTRVDFSCPCNDGTSFSVYTKANIPYASCPVCGSVCEPTLEHAPHYVFIGGRVFSR